MKVTLTITGRRKKDPAVWHSKEMEDYDLVRVDEATLNASSAAAVLRAIADDLDRSGVNAGWSA